MVLSSIGMSIYVNNDAYLQWHELLFISEPSHSKLRLLEGAFTVALFGILTVSLNEEGLHSRVS